MEKFAIDLDKVLDDFEFNEDCAEQIASINAPSNNASASTTKCNLDAPKNYSYHGSNERQVASLDVRSPMQGRVPVYSNTNYQKTEQTQDATDCLNHFYLQDYTGDNKLSQKQTVPPYDCEPASLTIHNDISHKFLQKQQNGSSSPKVDNRYDKKLNQPSAKPSVSNVFNSLNEYINAPTGSLEYVHTVSEDEEDVRSGRGTSNIEAVTSTSIDCAASSQVFISTPDASNISLPESDVNTSTSAVEESSSKDCQDLKVHDDPQAPTEPVTDNVQDKCSSIGVISVSSSKQTDAQRVLPDFALPSGSAEEIAPPELETKSVEACVSISASTSINSTANAEIDIVKCDTEQTIVASSDVNVASTDEIPEVVVPEESSSKPLPTVSETSCSVESNETTPAKEPESVNEAVESPKVAQKKFQFSNFDEHTEEDLMKYLSELEEQDKSADPDVVIESEPVESTEDISDRQIDLQDEDAYEAPIFETVTISDVPNIPEEDLSDKAKMLPVIDYTSDETKNETAVSDLTEKPSTQIISKDTEAAVSLQSEKVEEEEEEEEDEESFDSTTSELPVRDETSELVQETRVSLETDVSNEKDTQQHETQTRSTVQAPITDVKNSLELDAKPAQDQIEYNASDELRSQSTTESTKNSEAASDNTKESSSESSVSEPSDSIEKPNRPQTLDIVVPEGTSEPEAIGSSSVTPTGPAQSDIELAKDDCQGSSPDALDNSLESNSVLGKRPPIWVPDRVAARCMMCGTKFTMIKRRHHCRACGKVFCSMCSSWKYKLEYEESAELRVCVLCYHILTKAEREQGVPDWTSGYSTYTNNNEVNSPQGRQPNPNNPMEYCSTIPPLQQLAGGLPPPPTVMVPVGVLKRVGGTKHRTEGSKSVMFSDGIRPGCDLTELDMTWDVLQPVCRKPTSKKVTTASSSLVNTTPKRANLPRIDPVTECFVPQDPKLLPPTVTIHKGQVSYHAVTDEEEVLYRSLKNDCQPPVMFAINRNLYAYVKITNLNCCVNKICWNVTSRGLACVGQDEVILLVETIRDETRIPKDLLLFINQLYVEAMKGNTVSELGFAVFHGRNLLGSREHAGFLFIRQTLQCLQKIVLPPAPFLVGLLIHRWETPWAKVFPLRLLLRLGAEYRYYPCPLVSERIRDALYFEIGHTVMKVLADFRNYSYTLPGVRGLTIHLRNRMTDVMFPRNRYDQVIKGLNNSNDHVLAYASNFSIAADSHLVCIQTNTGDESNYQTQAINIQNKPRTVTGASFIVINGALKSSMGLSAKSSIVEDGLMVEIMPEKMEALKAALKNMQDFSIGCGRQGAPEPDETVNIKWVDNDVQFNIGVKSPIDGQLMDGVPSIRVHNGTDYKGTSRFIRWTEVFIINSDDHPNGVHDPVDINKLSGNIAKASCTALVKLLDLLATAGLTKLAVRTTIHPDNVGYEAGSEGTKLPPIYMNSLDNELIQVLHKAAQSSQDTHTVLELIFYVLDD